MSRSGYSDDFPSSPEEQWQDICYRGAVNSALKGKRGQKFLKEMLSAMDAMPVKELIHHELKFKGQYCALGVVGNARGIDMSKIDPDNPAQVSATFDIAKAMCREIVFMNDEACWSNETPARRWSRMRTWVAEQITA